ncbi:MAG: TlpA disulfide reductase family protein [Bacteroidia bacterium]|nr:TlpA disulfide reductase family protein [Bacteroidia bacterium]
MKKALILFLATIAFIACNTQTSQFTLEGTIEKGNINRLYLFEVINEQYYYIKLIDSISVTNNKFSYVNDSLQTQLYFLSIHANNQLPKTFEDGTYLFLRKTKNSISVSHEPGTPIQASVKNSSIEDQFTAFTKEFNEVGNQKVLDSLDQLFFAARDCNDTIEMQRIKEYSAPYYDDAMQRTDEWLKKQIEDNKAKGSLFGLYLYYTYHFQNINLTTLDEINAARTSLNNYDDEAKQSAYFSKIKNQLTQMEQSAIGHEAPEITGLDAKDNEMKLSDFRGKYVIVDFWSSSCSWCRLETPNLAKTYNQFKDKNFTILGVSSDFKKDDWLKAIEEDGSHWDHIMLRKEDINKIMNHYSIIGIPEILLIDPQGVILAKGLRGESIYNTVAEHIK